MAVTKLTFAQFAPETTWGTAVTTATHKWNLNDRPTIDREAKAEIIPVYNGTFVQGILSYIPRKMGMWQLKGPLTYEQARFLFSQAVYGLTAPSTSPTTGVYVSLIHI